MPGAPAAPSAIEGDAQVLVQWSLPAESGSSPVSGYVVLWEGGSQAVGPEQTAVVVTGLSNGHGYSFVVSAVNQAGMGPASAPSAVVYPGGAPDAPTPVVAVGGPGQAVITWPEANARGRPVTGYTVTTFSGETVTTTGTTATVTGLRAGRYTFAVTATNALGTSAPSNSNETIVTVALPGPPLTVTAVATATGALVRWSAPAANGGPATGYVVRSLPEGLSATTAATEATISGLQAGMNYKFKVSATNQSGEGEPSVPSEPIMLKQGPSTCTATPFLGGAPDPIGVMRPVAVSSADLDADGRLDLVVMDATTVYVSKGRGDGTFDTGVPHPAGSDLSSLAVADLNGDSFMDVVVTSTSGSLIILPGDGLAGLGAPRVFPTGGETQFVAIAQLDANPGPDLVVVNEAERTVAVFLNDGTATFVASGSHGVGWFPSQVVAADFNRDGVRDLAVPNGSGELNVLVGNGDGTFRSPLVQPLGASNVSALTVGDFDADGDTDLVAVRRDQVSGSVLLGNGDATFSGASLADPGFSDFVTSGDLDGDGHQDLVLLRPTGGQVRVMRGTGSGSFHLVRTHVVGSLPGWTTLGDFNADGFIDVVTANQGSPGASAPTGSVSILLGSATGFFTPNRMMFGEYVMTAFVADDFDVDGRMDVAVAQQESPGGWDVMMLLGTGDASFQPAFKVGGLGTVAEMRSGDFNRDGLPDLAVTDVGSWGPNLAIFMGMGGGHFQRSVRYEGNGGGPFSLTLDDFNSDGLSDLAVATRSYFGVDVYLGTPSGTFGDGQRHLVGGGPRSIVSADFNRDGVVDLATANELGNTVSVLRGQGNGGFSVKQDHAVGTRPVNLAVADLNGDLFPDLVTANEVAKSLTVLSGRAAGGFAPAITIPLVTTPLDVSTFDVTLDGKVDLLVALANGRVELLKGNGDGTFAAPVFFSAANSTRALALGHFDGDGRPDVAVLGAGVSVLRNVCGP